MIVFDTETTGLVQPKAAPIAKQPQIIEFAAVKLDDKTLKQKGQIEFFCNPGKPLPDKIVEITGITDGVLKDEPPFSANYKSLVDFFLGEEIMLAHNLAFDRDLLAFELMRIDRLTQFPWPPVQKCSVELTYGIKKHRLNLAKLYEMAFGEKFKDAHRAMSDTKALARVVRWMREEELV